MEDKLNIYHSYGNFETIQISQKELQIDTNKHRYPRCIVWTQLPAITRCVPWVGHTGIGTSTGIIHDFASSYTIAINNFTFGETIKYVKLDDNLISNEEWDRAIKVVDDKFRLLEHDIVRNNCHHYVAEVLNTVKYQNKSNWTQLDIWWLCLIRSQYTKLKYFFSNYAFCFGIFIFIAVISVWLK